MATKLILAKRSTSLGLARRIAPRQSRRACRLLSEALEPRRLLTAAAGDVGAGDVFLPTPATWAHGADNNVEGDNNEAGQTIINITKLDLLPRKSFWTMSDGSYLGATPSATPRTVDSTDNDSLAFNAVIDFIWHRIDLYQKANPGNVDGYDDPRTNFVIFVPAGEYDLRTTVRDQVHYEQSNEIQMAHLRILGQGRTGADAVTFHANGPAANYQEYVIDLFTRTANVAGDPNPVARQDAVNARPGRNAYENFNLVLDPSLGTAHVGGMQVSGANAFRMKNVSITGNAINSRTANDPIAVGLCVRAPTSGVISNVTVDGFDEGIRLQGSRLITPVITAVTLRNQLNAGIVANGGQPTVENLLSVQTYSTTDGAPPAILAREASAVTVLGGNFQLTLPPGVTTPKGSAMQAQGAYGTAPNDFSGSTITAFRVVVDGDYAHQMMYDTYAQDDRDGDLTNGWFGAIAAPTAVNAPNHQSLTNDFGDYARTTASAFASAGVVSYDAPGGDDYLGGATVATPGIVWIPITGTGMGSVGGSDNVFDAADFTSINAEVANHSGKLIGLFFTNRLSVFKATYTVPANVVAIDFNYGFVDNEIPGSGVTPILSVAAGADNDGDGAADGQRLVISNISRAFTSNTVNGKKVFAQLWGDVSATLSPRTVLFDSISSVITAIDDATGNDVPTIYLQNAAGFLQSALKDKNGNTVPDTFITTANYYARGVNSEGPDKVAFGRISTGATLVIAGFKTEQDNVNFEVDDTGKLCVLGGGSSQEAPGAITYPILRYYGAQGARAFLTFSTFRRPGDPKTGVPLRTDVVVGNAGLSPNPLKWNVDADGIAGKDLPQRKTGTQRSYDYFVPYLALADVSSMRWMNGGSQPVGGVGGRTGGGSPQLASAQSSSEKTKRRRTGAASAVLT